MKQFLLALSVFCALTSAVLAERVLVVGDSITAQSNLDWGYAPIVRKALADAGVENIQFVPLGWSGQTVAGWHSVVKRSFTDETVRGDRPEILFKKEFDLGADTIIIFLGMNDVLCPYVVPTEEGYAKWKADYCTLIDLIRSRVQVKRILICPPTMLTENPYVVKNLIMDKMGEIMVDVAKEKNCEFLDLRSEIKRFFMSVRTQNQNFHFTPDCVHPGNEGHRVMAWTFLNALGQKKAAEIVYAEMPDWLKDFDSPGFSLFVLNSSEPGKMFLRGFVRNIEKNSLQVTCPDGWELEEIRNLPGDEFEICLRGHSKNLTSTLRVKSGNIQREVKLNAPFFVSEFFDGKPFRGGDSYEPDATRSTLDDDILAGKAPLAAWVNGKPVQWTVYYPQADVTGFDIPCAIDFASIENGQQFQTAYVVRKVKSPKPQTVKLNVNALSFSTMAYPTIYVNGKKVWENCVSPRHRQAKDYVMIDLKEGENLIAARVGHFTWQWSVEFALEGEGLEY
ncbi:MAG: hypothetical protein IJF17_01385 [Thermoguttaceae bacterium]|nr:hypothetical protein [Thermoguttaceae bacterium]